ncbi:MAG: hypothetical protein DI639_05320 [Leifsonia xyli]|nr:MAG: hypothetical protein DI639_05320 [Leifsonia xyli]
MTEPVEAVKGEDSTNAASRTDGSRASRPDREPAARRAQRTERPSSFRRAAALQLVTANAQTERPS